MLVYNIAPASNTYGTVKVEAESIEKAISFVNSYINNTFIDIAFNNTIDCSNSCEF